MPAFCQLFLTCENTDEATKIADSLLGQRLIACAKQVAAKSSFWWQSKIDKADEVMLVMESRSDLFDKVEAEVKKLHSYETFVLYATPIESISKEAEQWLNKELKR